MKTLFPYQREALQSVLERIGTQQRILVVMATGLGKTVVAGALARWWRRNRGSQILFLVHLWEAVDQAVAEFREALGPQANLQVLNGGSKLDPTADVVFCTFQTMQRRYRKIRRNAFGLVVVDEGHRSKANTYEPIVEHFEPDLRFAMTATPDRMDGRDIRELFGEPVYSYPLARALAEHRLADVEYRVLMDNVSLAALRRIMVRIGRGDRQVSRDMIDRQVFLAERLDAIVKIVKAEQKTRRQTIIFCNSRRHARAVERHFSKAKTFYTGLPGRILEERFRAFRAGELQTLIVVNKFNEAIDIPDADLIVFLRTTESQTIWLQQLGRGLRKKLGKKNVLVLDFVANCDRIREVGQLVDDTRRHMSIADDNVEVHRAGIDFNFDAEARDILTVLKRIDRDFYPTWDEAAGAARKLGIRVREEYKLRYRDDPRLSSVPQGTYRTSWMTKGGWRGFLGQDPRRTVEVCYRTWRSAAKSARALGITSAPEYAVKYREDPRLPSVPNVMYVSEWKKRGGWGGFLGHADIRRSRKDCHKTWRSAARAARALGIASAADYGNKYREDARLPRNPDKTYASAWKKRGGWPGFLGRTPRRSRQDFYAWRAASKAARALGITSGKRYLKEYKADPRLPANPNTVYAAVWRERGGWAGFLGHDRKPRSRDKLYQTWEEAAKAAQALGICSNREYHRGYKTDPLLPAHPSKIYKGDWGAGGGWPGFLGKIERGGRTTKR